MNGPVGLLADTEGLGILHSSIPGFLVIVVIILGISLDRRWLSHTPLTPLSVALFGIFTRAVIGPLLMSAGEGGSLGEKAAVMISFRSQSQLLWLIFAVALVIPYIVLRKKFKGVDSRRPIEASAKAIAIFVVATGLFSLLWIYTGLWTGSASRDPDLYAHWVGRFFKPDAMFIAFGRLRDSFYFLVPLSLMLAKRNWLRVIITAIVALNLSAALELGGRGIVLIPVMEMYFGLFLLGFRKRVLCLFTCLMLIIGLTGAQLLSGNHKMAISNLSISPESVKSSLSSTGLVKTGLALYGCSDAYNFTVENIARPGAGWVRSERWLTAWLPSFVKGSSKGSARDAHIIAEQLEQGTSREIAESMDYKSFSCVSFGGDLFWRWRWVGVVFGSAIFGVIYYTFTVGWRRVIGLDSLSGCLAFCFPVSFLSLYPSGSVGETFWLWLWDIQKYLLLFAILRVVDKKVLLTTETRR